MKDRVLEILQDCDRNPGELKDLLECSYPELFTALEALQSSGEVDYYFSARTNGINLFPWESAHPVLTYRLIAKTYAISA